MRVSWAALSDPGLRRDVNEDTWCARPDIGLFVVADGMGGHAAGEVASRVAVEAIEEFARESAAADRHRTWPFPYDPAISLNGNRLKSAFRIANRRIAATSAGASELRGMATTACGVLVGNGAVSVAHVGDSRVYLLRGGELRQVTIDHSWVEEQVRAGVMDAHAARQHPWRNVVTRALSGGDDPEADVADLPLQPGDRLLLCSDGLSGVVPHDEIAARLGAEGALEGVCASLIEAANAAGGPDNITALVLDVS
ncbi:MAG: serine/threonine-protein phosphatase [Acidobacteria bacterium]|nr:serine/threonine-protein phosphatase [Acidobacteriota bacterium]